MLNKQYFKIMFDHLEYYNNCDVIPMIEAINKMFDFHRAKSLDMFKDVISLPGLPFKMLMKCTNAIFYYLKNKINFFILCKGYYARYARW